MNAELQSTPKERQSQNRTVTTEGSLFCGKGTHRLDVVATGAYARPPQGRPWRTPAPEGPQGPSALTTAYQHLTVGTLPLQSGSAMATSLKGVQVPFTSTQGDAKHQADAETHRLRQASTSGAASHMGRMRLGAKGCRTPGFPLTSCKMLNTAGLRL